VYFFFHRYFYLRDPADKKNKIPDFGKSGRQDLWYISVNIVEIRYRIQYDKF